MILGVAVGLTAKQLTPWASTARRHAAAERIVLLAQKPDEYDALHEKYGIEVIGASLAAVRGSKEADDPVYVFKSRWRAIADFLALDRTPEREIVLLTDTRDVVFQRYPVLTMPESEDVLVATEGVRFVDEPWNLTRLKAFFPASVEDLALTPYICAGVVQARAFTMLALAQAMWRIMADKPGEADQMALNVVLRDFESVGGVVNRLPYSYAWTAHLAQHPLSQITKHARVRTEPIPTIDGTSVLYEGVPFAIVHQWPYVPALRALSEES